MATIADRVLDIRQALRAYVNVVGYWSAGADRSANVIITAAIKEAVEEARAEAYEDAAQRVVDMANGYPPDSNDSYYNGWKDALAGSVTRIRARAKEVS